MESIKTQDVYPTRVCGTSRIGTTSNVRHRHKELTLDYCGSWLREIRPCQMHKRWRSSQIHSKWFLLLLSGILLLLSIYYPRATEWDSKDFHGLTSTLCLPTPCDPVPLCLATVRLIRRFPRHPQSCGQSLQQLLEILWSETRIVYLIYLMSAMNKYK